MKKGQPVAIINAIQVLTRLNDTHGIEAVHHVYGEVVAEIFAGEERETWRAKIAEAQRETFALLERD